MSEVTSLDPTESQYNALLLLMSQFWLLCRDCLLLMLFSVASVVIVATTQADATRGGC